METILLDCLQVLFHSNQPKSTSRNTPKYDEILLKFDPKLNNLTIVTDDDILAKASDPEAFKLGLALAKKMFQTIERKELLEYLEKDLRWSIRKIEDKLKKFVDNEIEFETALGPTILTKERGQSTVYKMVALDLVKSPEDNLQEKELGSEEGVN